MMRTCPCSTVLSLTRTNFHGSSTCYTTCSFVGRSATATRTTRFSKSSATNRTPTSYTWRTIDIFTRTDTVINKSLDGSSFNIYFGLFDISHQPLCSQHSSCLSEHYVLFRNNPCDTVLSLNRYTNFIQRNTSWTTATPGLFCFCFQQQQSCAQARVGAGIQATNRR